MATNRATTKKVAGRAKTAPKAKPKSAPDSDEKQKPLPHPLSKPDSVRALAAKWQVNPGTISRWKAKGIEVTDDDAVMEYLRGLPRENRPKNWQHIDEMPTGERSLKERKLELEIVEREFKLAVMLGNYTKNEEIRMSALSATAQFQAGLRQMASELAPTLEGMSAAEIQRTILDRGNELVRQWKDSTSELYIGNHVDSD